MPGKGRDLSLEPRHRGREQGDTGCDAGIGDCEAGGEIVGPVEHEVGACDRAARGSGVDMLAKGLDFELAIEFA